MPPKAGKALAAIYISEEGPVPFILNKIRHILLLYLIETQIIFLFINLY